MLSNFASEEDKNKISPDHFAPYKFEIFDDYIAISWDTISIYFDLKNERLLPDFVCNLAERDKDFNKAIKDFTYANTSN